MNRLGCLAASLALSACTNTPPQLATGLAALQTDTPEVALAICTGITRRSPRDIAAMNCKGDALVALRRVDEADAVYTQALILQPEQAATLLRLGRIRLASNPKRAEVLFKRALIEQPRDAVLLNDLGIAEDLQGSHAEAQRSYSAAIAADPDMRAARVNLALSMALGGHPGDAARMLPAARTPSANARERHDLAAVLAMDGRLEDAKQLLQPELQGADLDAALAGYRALGPRPGAR